MKIYFSLTLSVACILLFNSTQAQKFEAEDATLAGGAEKVANSAVSGGFYVAQQEGQLSWNITIEEEGFYEIYLIAASPSGNKTNTFSIDGASVDFTLAQNSEYISRKVVSSLKLTEGEHKVSIFKSWGWINIDYIEFQPVNPSDRFDTSKTPVTPNPTDHAMKLYRFLYDNYGEKIISGAMTLNSMDEINWLKSNTGKEPALVGLDFMHCGRGYTWYNDLEPVNDAKKYYARNGIPAFCWHWRDPLRKTEAFYTNDTNFDISKINDENSPEYKAMIQDIDYISGLLKKLQDDGVPVLWRPLHEASGGWFWWGAKGPGPCKKLYRLMYDRMVNHNGLKNLIWVWTSQLGDNDWYPGDDVVDIVGRDIYKDGDHSSQILEFNLLNEDFNGKKMITLSESGSFPDVDNLIKDGAAWSYFMPWYGDFVRNAKYNSLDLWKKMFAHDYVLTLDEMPDLKSYTTPLKTWRSSLYPENWKPGYKDSKGRFLHDFSYAGYHQGEKQIPDIQNNIVNVTEAPYLADNSGETDVTSVIQQALDDVGQAGGGVVYLPAGIYKVNPGSNETALRIQYNNTILRGAGIDATFIFNDATYMRQKNIIWMMGQYCTWSEPYGKTTNLATDLLFPTQVIPVKSVEGFNAGEDIILRTDGTDEFIEEHGMDGIWADWAARVMFLRTIDSIDVENNLIYIDSPTRYYMKMRDNARVYHAKEHISECGIEKLSIGNRQNEKSGWDEETYTVSGTGAYDVHASHAIQLKYAQNCWVKNVNTYKPDTNTDDIHLLSNCLLLNQCRGITVDSCFFQKPQYEGGGGNGYMFTLTSNDCLVKNCRANDARHNYDFKYAYSNGNVIHNCIAENSKYSSDFHMYLSMANLFDVTTVDKDYLESQFRPWGGSVIHGYSSTQSVFYNTKGVAYHPNRNYIIDSRQFGYGYVIGTSGDAPNVQLDPVSGTANGYTFDTGPRDFAEGISEGADLTPQSLYLDQLQRRLNDTNGIGSYRVSVMVKHSYTEEPLANCEVNILNRQNTTNAEGEATFDNVNNLVILNLQKKGFYSISNKQLTVYSDTILTFYLIPREFAVTVVVHDQSTNETFFGVPVQFNNTDNVTDEAGEAHFQAYEGNFNYFVEKNSYENASGSVTVQSDTTFHVFMTRSNAYIKIKLKEGTTPVNGATVILNNDTLISNNLGMVTFRDLAVLSEYNFAVFKGGYKAIGGNLYLTTDTTLNLAMEQNASAIFSVTGKELKIWPNPVREFLHIELTGNFSNGKIEIVDLNGNCLKSIAFRKETSFSINLSDLSAGMYLLQVASQTNPVYHLFLKN